MDFASPLPTMQAWGGGLRPSSPAVEASGDGPEVTRRQADWERQIETLDQKEMELHQTQLRLIREQTATFIRDLNALRNEVMNLKSRQEADRSSLFSSVGQIEGKQLELQDFFGRDRHEKDGVQSMLTNKVASLERDLPNLRDELGALRAQVRSVETSLHPHVKELHAAFQKEIEERSHAHGRMERRIGELDDSLAKQNMLHQEMDRKLSQQKLSVDQEREEGHRSLADMIHHHGNKLEKEAQDRDFHHGRLNERLDKLERDMQIQLGKRISAWEEDLEEVRRLIGGEAVAREEHHKMIHSAVQKHLQLEKDAREKMHGSMSEAMDAKIAETGHAIHHNSASLQERLDYLERQFGDSADQHAQALEAAHRKLQEQVQAQGATQAQLAHHASLADRVQFLEKAFGDSADKHTQEIEKAKQKIDALHGQVRDANSSNHASLQDRLDFVEQMLGDSVQRHSQEMKSSQEKLLVLQGKVDDHANLHGKILDDLQKGHSDRGALQVSIEERLEYLEKLMGDSAVKHAQELDDLRNSHIKLQGAHDIHGRELDATKAVGSKLSTVEERIAHVEQRIGSHAEKHSEELTVAHSKVDQLHGRIAQLEDKHQSSHAELRKAHVGLCSEKAASDAHHQSLKDRVDYIEGLIGDSADKHSKAMDAAQARLDQMHGRLSSCERHGSAIDDLKKSHATLWSDKSALDSHHSTLKERVDFLEGVVGDSADRHMKELENIKAAHAKLASESKAQQSKLGDQMVQDKEARDVHHASVQERLLYIENLLGESAEKHDRQAKVLEEHKSLHSKHASDARSREASHATLAERINYVEKCLGDSADKHSQELADALAKVESAHNRITEERMAREAHGASMEVLKKSQGNLAAEKLALEKNHLSMAERMEYLEKAIGDSAEKHSRELEVVKAAHQKLSTDSKAKDTSHASTSERVTQLQREKDDLQARHLSLGERVDYMEKLIGDNAEKHAQDLEAVKSSQAKHGKDLDGVKKVNSYHSSFEDRLNYLEKMLGDSADKHAEDLSNAHAKIEQLHGKVSEERSSRESMGNHIRDHLSGEQKARDAHHSSVEDRLRFLESVIGDNADKHSKDLEDHRSAHGKAVNDMKALYDKHASTIERLNYLEQAIGDSADKHAQELFAAHTKIEQLHGRLADERSRSEVHSSSVKELVGLEKQAREGSHETITNRLSELEALIRGTSDKHTTDLESHKSSTGKLTSEIKAREAAHASLTERLEYIERTMGDSADKHAKEIQEAHMRLDQVHSRLSSVEKHGERVEDLRKSQSSISNEKMQLEVQHSSLKERVEFLEASIGDAADRHTKALADLRTAHSKLANDTKARDASHTSLGERMGYVEKVLGDSATKHAQDISESMAKIEAMHGRVTMCESHSDHIEALRKAHATLAGDKASQQEHHASLAERVDYLEKATGDSADRHARELAQAHSKLDMLHSRLGEETKARDGLAAQNEHMVREKSAREAQHASLEERLGYLESYLGESADKHAKDLQATHGSLQNRLSQLEQRFGNELAEMREHFNGEKGLRGQHADAIGEHLEAERRARDAHEMAVTNQLAAHKSAFETHEKLMLDHLGHEKAARERHLDHVEATLGREKETRERHNDLQMEHVQRESAAREAQHKDFHEMILKERALREQHHSTYQEFLGNERNSRQILEDLVSQERLERSKHAETVTERVDSLQRTVGIFDSLIRKEMDERSKEQKRIWDAIDNHTHDLSTQVLDVDGDRPDDVMEAVSSGPGPSRVLQSSGSTPMVGRSPSFTWQGPPPAQSSSVLISRMDQAPLTRQYPGSVQAVPASPVGDMYRSALVSGVPQSTATVSVSSLPAANVTYGPPSALQAPAPISSGSSRGMNGTVSPCRAAKVPDNHHMEKVTCGHTRYAGERAHPAELHT